jgi:acyl carrier protein
LLNGNAKQHIQEFILKRFPLAKKRDIGESHKLLESGIIDSLGILDLVSALEKDFGITISDEELVPENFQTVVDIAAFVASKQGKQGA